MSGPTRELRERLKSSDQTLDPQMFFDSADELLVNAAGLSMKGVDGAPDWLEYESIFWELSVNLSEWLRRVRFRKGSSDLMDVVARLVTDRRLGKGRQNLVLVLGKWGGAHYRDTFASLLGDQDVQGHALKALRLLDIGDFLAEATQMASGDGSIFSRKESKQYLKRFSA